MDNDKYAICKFQSRMIFPKCRSIELLAIQRSFLWGNESVWLVRRSMLSGLEGREGDHLTGRNLEYVAGVKGLEQPQRFLV